jgi:hypothetical protein
MTDGGCDSGETGLGVSRENMKRSSVLWVLVLALMASWAQAQPVRPEPVFQVDLLSDRESAVAGEPLRLAVVLNIDQGWHINSEEPGDEFFIPTTVDWTLPDGWPDPTMEFPEGEELRFSFSDSPLEVWQGRVVLAASLVVPADAVGAAEIRARVSDRRASESIEMFSLDRRRWNLRLRRDPRPSPSTRACSPGLARWSLSARPVMNRVWRASRFRS